jgi:predicted nucleic acid-binding protein
VTGTWEISADDEFIGLIRPKQKQSLGKMEDFWANRAIGPFPGTRDLKIAATALATHSLLLSANRTDFQRVPGLRVENWLE